MQDNIKKLHKTGKIRQKRRDQYCMTGMKWRTFQWNDGVTNVKQVIQQTIKSNITVNTIKT